MFVERRFLFRTTNVDKDNIHCDVKGKILNFLNKFLHETLLPHPIIILIVFSCMLKIVELCDEFPQNMIP